LRRPCGTCLQWPRGLPAATPDQDAGESTRLQPSIADPIASPFGATSTAEEVIRGVDLTGKTAIVTGGYSGLGLETVRVLARAGASVVVPARDTAKAETALIAIPRTRVMALDLMAPASIDAFAKSFLAEHGLVDMFGRGCVKTLHCATIP
jgi:hypothetical protein